MIKIKPNTPNIFALSAFVAAPWVMIGATVVFWFL
jgi:hypothetical protein